MRDRAHPGFHLKSHPQKQTKGGSRASYAVLSEDRSIIRYHVNVDVNKSTLTL